jgi:hypothetical protein
MPRMVGKIACLLLAGSAGIWVGHVDAQASAPAGAASAALPVPASVPAPVAVEDIPLADASAAGVKIPSAPNAWGGPRTGNEPTLSDRVVRYQIDATLDPKTHSVEGHQKLTWRNRSDRAVSSVYLHLYLNGFEGEGSTFFTERRVLAAGGDSRGTAEVKKGEWGYIDLKKVEQDGTTLRSTFVHPDGGPATDHTVVRVDLAQPVPAGGSVTLDMDFHSQLPRVIERTGWFGDFNLVAQWFPKIAVLELAGERGATAPRWNAHEFHFNSEFYADFGEFDVHVTAPKAYVIGAVGEQQGEPVEKDGLLTWHFIQGDVHDFAWMAASGYRTLDGSYEGPGSPKVKVRVLYPPEYVATAAPTLKATVDSLAYFSRTLGPYPYHTVTAVVPPFNATEAGGMEYPTFFTAEGFNKIEPGTQDEYESDFVTIHEFGHGYFYGLLASNEFEEPMLDEGLNEYWDERMLRERKQGFDLVSPLMKWMGITPSFTVFELERLSATLSRPADPLSQNSWNRLSSTSYGTVYSRTATAMHDLEERLGKDVTERAFKQYYASWRYRHPSVADLRETLAEVSGKPAVVDEIFNQYVYGTDRIDDQVKQITSEEELPRAGTVVSDGKRTEVSAEDNDKRIETQRDAWTKAHPSAKPGTGPFPYRTTVTVWRDGAQVPQTLRVSFADGSVENVRWDDQRRWARFDFVKPVKGVSAELDPDGKVYLDSNKLNDSRTVEVNGNASRRWASDVAAALQGFYSFLVTL